MLGQRDNTGVKALALHVTDPGSISGTAYGPWSTAMHDPWTTESGVSPEQYQLWSKNQSPNRQTKLHILELIKGKIRLRLKEQILLEFIKY